MSTLKTTILKILITGATRQVGGKTINFLLANKDIDIMAAVRSIEKQRLLMQ